MKLLIDAGNTRIKWASVDEETWLRSGALPVEQAGELPHQFAGLQGIRQIWASNVAGEEIAQHIRNAGAGLSVRPRFIVAQEAQCGVRNGYSSPSQLGSDRWAALIAAWHLARGTCLVVNSGTATTVDALSATGEFIGGLILPGVELMQRSLRDAAVQLQAAQRQPGQGEYAPFPLNTADALYSGALQASCGAIERQYALLGDSSAPVVLSGGAEAVLRNRLNVPLRIVDNLVLQGLWLIAQETNA
ncbi:MAG TPA: type III pantothenate kinase [Gallionella sp.]|nr:type III pantothenate kinase [Gallionella sp.]